MAPARFPWRVALPVAALVVLATLVFYTAWLGDDAYITFRTIDNWRHGFGLRWNTIERVQAYTHPLWLFVLSGGWAITGEPYFSTLAISTICAVSAAAILAFRIAQHWGLAAIAVLMLAVSRAYLDYSTSGLENPLTFLLVALFLWQYWRPRTPARAAGVVALGALAACNRLDLLLLLGPAMAHVTFTTWKQSWRLLVLATLPLVAWEAFSLIYYGFPFPNTAYAKLPPNVSAHELVPQGLVYLAESLRHDPITLTSIAVAFAWTMAKPAAERETLALGTVLYLAYVVRIGGDFMDGRFFAVLLLVAVALLVRSPVTARGTGMAMAALVALGCATGLRVTLSVPQLGDPERFIKANGVTDERLTYAPYTRLVSALQAGHAPTPGSLQTGLRLRREGTKPLAWIAVGMIGYGAGPNVVIVDRVALADPLLARLPALHPWRIGHFERHVPDGYLDTMASGRVQIENPELARYYTQLALVTQGPIWSRERWRAIIDLNLGRVAPPRLTR